MFCHFPVRASCSSSFSSHVLSFTFMFLVPLVYVFCVLLFQSRKSSSWPCKHCLQLDLGVIICVAVLLSLCLLMHSDLSFRVALHSSSPAKAREEQGSCTHSTAIAPSSTFVKDTNVVKTCEDSSNCSHCQAAKTATHATVRTRSPATQIAAVVQTCERSLFCDSEQSFHQASSS